MLKVNRHIKRNKAYEDIANHIRKAYDINITPDMVKEMVKAQTRTIAIAFEVEEDIQLPEFGSFIIKQGRKMAVEAGNEFRANGATKNETEELVRALFKEQVTNNKTI